MSSSVPPPAYNSSSPKPTKPAYGSTHYESQSEPLLGEQRYADEDDFDVGVTVSSSSLAIRHAFVRKVYAILFIQLLFSATVGALYRSAHRSNLVLIAADMTLKARCCLQLLRRIARFPHHRHDRIIPQSRTRLLEASFPPPQR